MEITTLKALVSETLENVELNGFYPSVSESNTDFGTSFYIQNEKSKIRISDHSVSNFDRMMNEVHFFLKNISLDVLKQEILKQFSEEYISLVLSNGDSHINFGRKILKSEFPNWKTAQVWFQEEQEIPIKLEEIKNWNVLEEKELTKKGDKRFCRILRNKYSFGAKNIITGEVIQTRFPLIGDAETIVNYEN